MTICINAQNDQITGIYFYEPIWLDRGGDPIPDRDGLEQSYVAEYEELGMVAFESERYKRFVEHRDGIEQA